MVLYELGSGDHDIGSYSVWLDHDIKYSPEEFDKIIYKAINDVLELAETDSDRFLEKYQLSHREGIDYKDICSPLIDVLESRYGFTAIRIFGGYYQIIIKFLT